MSSNYKINNWSEYNKSLVARGDITLWLPQGQKFEDFWHNHQKSGKRGRSFSYSSMAIEFCLTIRYLFRFNYRITEGFINSLFKLSNLALVSPDYTQIHRRGQSLQLDLKSLPKGKGSVNIVVDSTGLKVYGEGEWKVRKHGPGKRRQWRKLHLAVDPSSHEILSSLLTTNKVADIEAFKPLMGQINQPIDSCFGDGAYDCEASYTWCFEHDVRLVVPPRRDAMPSRDPCKKSRNEAIKRISILGWNEEARQKWKKEVGYHRRSIAETAMHRFKALCGDRLLSRLERTQHIEALIKVNIVNAFTGLGMPISQPRFKKI